MKLDPLPMKEFHSITKNSRTLPFDKGNRKKLSAQRTILEKCVASHANLKNVFAFKKSMPGVVLAAHFTFEHF
jgi:hypothetical protein